MALRGTSLFDKKTVARPKNRSRARVTDESVNYI